jgi:hypothetical protein
MLQMHPAGEHDMGPGVCTFFALKVRFCREIGTGSHAGELAAAAAGLARPPSSAACAEVRSIARLDARSRLRVPTARLQSVKIPLDKR